MECRTLGLSSIQSLKCQTDLSSLFFHFLLESTFENSLLLRTLIFESVLRFEYLSLFSLEEQNLLITSLQFSFQFIQIRNSFLIALFQNAILLLQHSILQLQLRLFFSQSFKIQIMIFNSFLHLFYPPYIFHIFFIFLDDFVCCLLFYTLYITFILSFFLFHFQFLTVQVLFQLDNILFATFQSGTFRLQLLFGETQFLLIILVFLFKFYFLTLVIRQHFFNLFEQF